jgi:hypothetical protein
MLWVERDGLAGKEARGKQGLRVCAEGMCRWAVRLLQQDERRSVCGGDFGCEKSACAHSVHSPQCSHSPASAGTVAAAAYRAAEAAKARSRESARGDVPRQRGWCNTCSNFMVPCCMESFTPCCGVVHSEVVSTGDASWETGSTIAVDGSVY